MMELGTHAIYLCEQLKIEHYYFDNLLRCLECQKCTEVACNHCGCNR